jgi:hypothetical protein
MRNQIYTFSLVLTFFVIMPTKNFLCAQNPNYDILFFDTRMHSQYDQSNVAADIHSVGFSYYTGFKKQDIVKRFRIGLLMPLMYHSNFQKREIKLHGYSLGAMMKADVAPFSKNNKWFISSAIGMEGHQQYHSGGQHQAMLAQIQIGSRYIDPKAFFRDLDIGASFTLPVRTTNNFRMPFMAGVYFRTGILSRT